MDDFKIGDKVLVEGKIHSPYDGSNIVVEINGRNVLVSREQVRPIDEGEQIGGQE